MEFLRIAVLVITLSSTLFAQLTIEEVTSDSGTNETTVIKESKGSNGRKNEWGAAFMSLAVPGVGQFYLEEKRKGAAFLSADIVLLAGVIFTEATSRRMFRNSMGYAQTYAGTKSGREWDDSYWEDIGLGGETITDNVGWNREKIDRDFESYYLGDDAWSWGSLESKEKYVEQRTASSDWHSASYIFIGGMVINRVISFVDARISATRYNTNILSSLDVYPHYSLASQSGGFTVVGFF